MHPIDTSNFFRENFMNMCRTTKVIANIGSYKQTNFCGLFKVQMQINNLINNLNVYLYDNALIMHISHSNYLPIISAPCLLYLEINHSSIN